jgi:hypothetical protein
MLEAFVSAQIGLVIESSTASRMSALEAFGTGVFGQTRTAFSAIEQPALQIK